MEVKPTHAANYLVVDVEIPQFQQNRVLDADYATRFPGATTYSCLAALARERGWEVLTADVFLAQKPAFRQAVSLSNEFTPFLSELMAVGVKPGVLISGESPAVARTFYKNLPCLSAPFRHAVLFRGSLCRLHRNVQGHPWLWPCPALALTTEQPWESRKLVGLVAGMKGVWSSPRTWLKEMPEALQTRWDRFRQPSLRLRDLYRLRWKMVRRFGTNPAFLLRGVGWDASIHGKGSWWCPTVRYANVPSPCADKMAVLGECRFALTIENAVYPGYVTEKIFDGLRAGAVPVYMGAPDIVDFVPPDCFVDYRDFPSPAKLWQHLAAMPETRWAQYREAGRVFLNSQHYQRHLEQNVAREWLAWLEESAQKEDLCR